MHLPALARLVLPVLALPVLVLTACTPDDPASASDPRRETHLVYRCDQNQRLEVSFAGDGETATVLKPDEVVPMLRVASASGARFRASDPRDSRLLDTKGRTATLYAGADRVLLANCVTAN
ncbi:MliC family protein [Paracoccus sp. p1-h21]|uniref:MliC family protein n=1 Tax=Paracoccus sp. p1-h21 TaxID=3366951 RepID=UPI00379A10F8